MTEERTDPMEEIKAMSAVAEALGRLDQDAVGRVLRWSLERFGVTANLPKAVSVGTQMAQGSPPATVTESGGERQFNTLADLYHAISPDSNADRALVAGYWFQYCQGEDGFNAQAVNQELKHLGHYLPHITDAFESLQGQRPSLVVQVRKTGNTRQARKIHKLTDAGKRAVEAMLAQHA